jgi:hypothetical protein
LLVATPEPLVLKDVLETRRIFGEVQLLHPDRICYVLNHPQPYAGLSVTEFSAATATPWFEISHGGDAAAVAALRGQSLVETRRTNTVARGVTTLAEQIANEAREAAALAGRPA